MRLSSIAFAALLPASLATVQAATVEQTNAATPVGRIFEKDGQRYQQFGDGPALPLHPGLSRAWGAGYSSANQHVFLTRPPFLMFALFAESPYRWYQGIPTRDSFAALRRLNRHPVMQERVTARPAKLPVWETGEDFARFLASITPEHRVLPAFAAAKDYADLYDWAVRQGKVTAQNEAYAEKSVAILARLAKAFPRWHAQKDRIGRADEDQSNSGLWIWPERRNQFKRDITGTLPAAQAYDLVYNAPAWKTLSARLGYDVRRDVDINLLQEALWHQARMGGPFGNYNNRDKHVSDALCRWAVALDDPVLYHFAIRLLEDQARDVFMADGTYFELCYVEFLVASLMEEYGELPAYADPPDWKDPFDGSHFAPRLTANEVLPSIARVRRHILQVSEFQRRLQLPDGRLWSLNESAWDKRPMELWYKTEGSTLFGQPAIPARSRSELLTWSGHSMLGRGDGPEQIQVRLEYSDHPSPHLHDDAFTLGLFAKGQELLADNSYVHGTRKDKDDGWRSFSRTAADHNTVVIHGTSQVPPHPWTPFSGPKPAGPHYFSSPRLVPGVKLLQQPAEGEARISQTLWVPDGLVQMMEVFHPHKRGGTHRRTVVVVPIDETNVYVLDVYRVAGGESYDWSAHGPSQHDYRIVMNLPLGGEDPATIPAGLHQCPELSYVRSLKTDQAFCFDMIVPEFGEFAATPIRRGCLRTTLIGAPETIVKHGLTANARQYEQADLGVRRSARKEHLVVTRLGPATTFVAVHEPYELGGHQPVVRKVAQQDFPGDTLAVTVTLPEREDAIFLAANDQGTAHIRDITFSGKAGFLSRAADGRVIRHLLVHGALLAAGNGPKLHADRTFTTTVRKISRREDGAAFNGFLVAGAAAAGLKSAGRWLTIELGDGHLKWFPIREVRSEGGDTWLMTDWEPGLALRRGFDTQQEKATDWVEYLYFPRTGVLGGLQARIMDVVGDE